MASFKNSYIILAPCPEQVPCWSNFCEGIDMDSAILSEPVPWTDYYFLKISLRFVSSVYWDSELICACSWKIMNPECSVWFLCQHLSWGIHWCLESGPSGGLWLSCPPSILFTSILPWLPDGLKTIKGGLYGYSGAANELETKQQEHFIEPIWWPIWWPFDDSQSSKALVLFCLHCICHIASTSILKVIRQLTTPLLAPKVDENLLLHIFSILLLFHQELAARFGINRNFRAL